ncbi:hypothetical protein NHQ30_005452 [Ciborinia camelliae]|nr:hypothetical protein NHQ30_005452 [Ciborinia camelliae]
MISSLQRSDGEDHSDDPQNPHITDPPTGEEQTYDIRRGITQPLKSSKKIAWTITSKREELLSYSFCTLTEEEEITEEKAEKLNVKTASMISWGEFKRLITGLKQFVLIGFSGRGIAAGAGTDILGGDHRYLNWEIANCKYTIADDHGVVFLYPTANLTFNYLDTINVTYTSPFPEPQIWVFCSNATDVTSSLITESHASVKAFNGSAPINFKWLGGSPCWFDLRPNSSAGHGANSPQFLIDQNKRATPVTLGLEDTYPSASATATSSDESSDSNSNDVTTTMSSTPTASSNASSNSSSGSASSTQTAISNTNYSVGGLSGGAKAGIGIGIGVMVLLAVAIGCLIWRGKQKARENDYAIYPTGVNEKASSPDEKNFNGQQTISYEMDVPDQKFELASARPVGEMSGINIRSSGCSVQSPTLGLNS